MQHMTRACKPIAVMIVSGPFTRQRLEWAAMEKKGLSAPKEMLHIKDKGVCNRGREMIDFLLEKDIS